MTSGVELRRIQQIVRTQGIDYCTPHQAKIFMTQELENELLDSLGTETNKATIIREGLRLLERVITLEEQEEMMQLDKKN